MIPIPPLTQDEFDSLPDDIKKLIDPETMDLDPQYYEPVKIGPTWAKNDDGSWYLPEHTLGWGIAEWCAKYLRNAGRPWKFTLEQLRWLLWWYAIDESGKFVYRKGVLQRLKGWGKDPLAAVLCMVELVGPCRFSHWDADGQPVGKRVMNAYVQIAAVSQTQTENTAALFASLASDEFIAEYGVKLGAELTYAMNGTSRLRTVTSSPRALEGNRVTFAILNEVQHWLVGNKGHAMYGTIKRNAEKMDGRWLAITNAYMPGEDSVGETLRGEYENWIQGRLAADPRLMYDSLEAHPMAPIHPLFIRRVLAGVVGDAHWLNLDTLVESMMDTTTPLVARLRMWLNRVVAGENAMWGPSSYEAIANYTDRIMPGDKIVLGFDGGKSDDSTALVAMRVDDGLAQLIRVWEKPEEAPRAGRTDVAWQKEANLARWTVDTEAVDAKVRECFEVFDVVGFYSDLHPWQSYVDAWNRDFGQDLKVKAGGANAIAWDMASSLKRSTKAHEALASSITDKSISIVHNTNFRAHFLNVHRRENNFGVSFGKESRESSRKVDIYAALMLAHECRRDFFGKVKPEEKNTGSRGWFL